MPALYRVEVFVNKINERLLIVTINVHRWSRDAKVIFNVTMVIDEEVTPAILHGELGLNEDMIININLNCFLKV